MIRKKINSEIKFNDDVFKVKLGTTDKKNPETIYAELGVYIKPNFKKASYTEDIIEFEKLARHYLKNKIKTSDICYSNNFITVVDIADERITCNKKSYLDIQIFLKTKIEKMEKGIFKKLSTEIHDRYIRDMLDFLKENLTEYGFSYTKTKK
jgi:hypothetical protein